MKKRVIGLVLAVVMCLGLAVPAMAQPEVIHDVISEWIWETALGTPIRNTVIIHNAIGVSVETIGTTRDGTYSIDEDTVFWITPGSLITFKFDFSERTDLVSADLTLAPMVRNEDGKFFYLPGAVMIFSDRSQFGVVEASVTDRVYTFVFDLHDWFMNDSGVRDVYEADPSGIIINAGGGNFVGIATESAQDTATPPTTDLATASDWAREGIARAIELNLVPQSLQSAYTQATTRAEFTALAVALYNAATGREITGRAEFNDTDDINVQKMAYLGVVQGVGGGNFAPDNQLTREQAAVMLARLANAIGQPLPPADPTFADNADVSDWAVDAVGQMQASGIMGGVGENRFAPGGDYTREQSIITILRLFDILD